MTIDAGARQPRFDQQTRRRIGILIALGLIAAIVVGIAVTMAAFARQGAADATSTTRSTNTAIGIGAEAGHGLDKVPTEVVREAYIAQRDDQDSLDRVRARLTARSGRISVQFLAHTDAAANELSTYLIEETGLHVDVTGLDDGSGDELVTAETPAAPLTLAVVHAVTLRGMEAAWLHGRCDYAGWDVNGILAADDDASDSAPAA